MTTPTTADFVGLAVTIYNQTNLAPGSRIAINGITYDVLDAINHSSSNGFYGAVLLNPTTNTLFVVDRGTEPTNWQDWATDIVMAVSDSNAQWNDAHDLAQFAATYAEKNGGTVYTVGHSLGGTLAQMQAALYGWSGITFNAYGAGEVFSKLGYSVSPNQNITNYRALFDLVSESSTQIGNVLTLETDEDLAFLSGKDTDPLDLIATIVSDHSKANFYDDLGSDPSGSKHGGVPTFVEANMFALTPSSGAIDVAQLLVSELGQSLAGLREIVATLSFPQWAAEISEWIDEKRTGGTAVVPAAYTLLANALDPSSNNIYRASLALGSPVVVQGLDPSTVQNDTLWAPGQTSGLTEDYLIARSAMLQAMFTTVGEGHLPGDTVATDDSNSYIYSDLKQSPDPLYSLIGTGENVYDVVFADDKGDTLSASPGTHAGLFGGAGNDTLFGGSLTSMLQGGVGDDEYVIDGDGTGMDQVLDTDGQGSIEWQFADGSTEVLSGGNDLAGTSSWTSADGKITYFENHLAGGITDLDIKSGNKTVRVDDFTNGKFGITLNTSSQTPPSDALQVTLQNSLDPGVVVAGPEFDDSGSQAPIASVLLGPDDTSGQIWAISGMSNATSIFGGTGSEWLLADRRTIEVSGFVDTSPIYIEAGSGAQSIIGGQGDDTLVGGSDTLTPVDVVFQPGTGPDPNQSAPYTVTGSQGFDWITGGGGDDLIEAGSGSTLIEGGTGGDTIIGGSGNDSIFAGLSYYGDGQSNDAVINLYDSNGVVDDVYVNGIGGFGFGSNPTAVGSQANLIIAGSGDDLIFGSLGDDTIYGGSGHDTIVGNNGTKTIYGGSGGGVIYADDNEALAAADGIAWQNSGASYSDTIYGGTGDTTIYGSGGADYLYAGGGNDVINVGNGSSFVSADSGNVTINGGTGDEIIDGGTGDDLINVGDGNTYVYAGLGTSTINAGAGNDTIEAGGGNDTLVGSTGAVTYVIGTNTGADTVELGSGPTTIQLVDGLDETNIVVRHVNSDLVLTDPVSDTQVTILGYFNGGSNLTMSFQGGTIWDASQILQATMAPSNGGEDTLVGTSNNDSIAAGVGDTLIVDSAGDNTLTGGYGSDTIEGGSGADTIEGGQGTTQIVGGSGFETYVFNLGDGSSTISESSASTGSDLFSYGASIATSNVSFGRYGVDGLLMAITDPNTSATSTVVVEHYFSSATGVHQLGQIKFADGTSLDKQAVTNLTDSFYGDGTDGELITSTLASATYYAGDGANVTVEGGSGNDMIYGGSSSDTLLGEGGSDTISDGIGADSISGAGGNNLFTIAGDQFADTVTGGSGNDTFDVQGASELLIGGGGTNTYVIDSLDLVPPAEGTSRSDIIISDATASDILNLVDVSSEGELSAALSGNDLVLTIDGSLDVTLKNITSGLTAPSVILPDGTTLDGAALYTMAGGDDAPQVNGTVPDLSATEGLGFQWALPSDLFSDPDPNDGIASIAASLIDSSGSVQPLPEWLQFDATSGSFSGKPSQTDVGTQYTIQLTVTDTHGATSSTQFNLSVVSDRAPVATGVEADQSLVGGQPFSIAVNQVQFSDPDIGDILTYKAVAFDTDGNPIALPGWVNFDPSTLTFSGTVPSFVDATSYKLGIEATDLQGLSVSSVFGLNLSNVDIPPHQGGAWESDVYDSQNQALDLDVSSWVAGQGTLTWTVSAPDGSPLPAWLHFDPTTRVFSADLTQATVGDTAIELTVSDGAGGTFNGTFSLHVQDVPDAPIATATPPDINASVGQSIAWTVPNGLFTDQDPGDQAALEYSVEVTPDWADLSAPATWANLAPWLAYDPATNTLAGTVPSTALGPYTVNVTATDLTGLTATTSFHIGISNTGVSSIYGSSKNDKLKGSRSAPNFIDGEGGNDTITGGVNAANWLLGAAGNDTLIGGTSGDYLDGGAGADVLQGGTGNDTIRSDTSDTIVYSAGDGMDDAGTLGTLSLLSQGLGITKMVADYSVTNDDGSGHGWRLELSDGGSITLHDYVRPDMFDTGGEAQDGEPVSVLLAGTPSSVDMAWEGVAESDGSDGDDLIYGQSNLDQYSPGSSAYSYKFAGDVIYGNAGNDTVMAGIDADSVDGGSGNDALYGGMYSDTLIGGAGNDTLNGDGGWNEVFDPGSANPLGNPGDDYLAGGDGDDVYVEDALPDYSNFNGNPSIEHDTIYDSSGNDELIFAQDDGVTEANVILSGNMMEIIDGSNGYVTFDISEIETVVFSDGTSITPALWTLEQPASEPSVLNTAAPSSRGDFLQSKLPRVFGFSARYASLSSDDGRGRLGSWSEDVPYGLNAGGTGARASGSGLSNESLTLTLNPPGASGPSVPVIPTEPPGRSSPAMGRADDPVPMLPQHLNGAPIIQSWGSKGATMSGLYGKGNVSSRGTPDRNGSLEPTGSNTSMPAISQSSAPEAGVADRAPASSTVAIASTGLGAPEQIAALEPQDESGAAPGAPADPLAGDPNDVTADTGNNPRFGIGEDGNRTLQSTATGRSVPSIPLTRVNGVYSASSAANSMIKALTAHSDLRLSSGESPAQIQLVDGTLWELSGLDRTLAAMTPALGTHEPRSEVSSVADLSHAQLVSAMASFSPVTSAESAPPLPNASEAYAIAIAAQMH